MQKKGVNFKGRLRKYTKISDLSELFKEFLKRAFGIRSEYTYEELIEKVERKKIEDEAKTKILDVCNIFNEMDYRPKKPKGEDIRKLKRAMGRVISYGLPVVKPIVKNKTLQSVIEKVAPSKAHKIISHRVVKSKKSLTSDIFNKIKKKIREEKDEELQEIIKFIKASMDAKNKKNEIMRDLREIGFDKDKIKNAMNKIKDNKI